MSTDNNPANKTTMQPESLIKELQECGILPINNEWFAGRLPPGTCAGMHPLEFFAVYDSGGLSSELQSQLPEPIPTPKNEFGRVAQIIPEVYNQHAKNGDLYNIDIPEAS